MHYLVVDIREETISMQFEILGGRYQLQDPIGRGGISTVYRALDLRMGRVVAIKVLREFYGSDPKFVARFQQGRRPSPLCSIPISCKSMTTDRSIEIITLSWSW
jgi:serine/threonine protein kinase